MQATLTTAAFLRSSVAPANTGSAPSPTADGPVLAVDSSTLLQGQKAVKQASDMAEANFNAVTNTAVNAAKTAAPRKR